MYVFSLGYQESTCSNPCYSFPVKLFESSGLMQISAVKSLLSALCQLSHQCVTEDVSGVGQASSQKIGSISFSVERIISILVNNIHSKYGMTLEEFLVHSFLFHAASSILFEILLLLLSSLYSSCFCC